MSRSTRLKQQDLKLSSGECVIELRKLSKQSSKAGDTAKKLRSTKGNSKKLSSANVLLSLQPRVLRDRTNLTKAPTTKLDVLKKGLEDKDAAGAKTMTDMRAKRTRVGRSTTNHDTENIESTEETKTKKDTRNTKKEGRVSKIKKPVIRSTSSDNSDVSMTENEQEIATTSTRVTRNEDTHAKVAAFETKRTRKVVLKEQLKMAKTRAQKNRLSTDKPARPSTKVSEKKSSPSTAPRNNTVRTSAVESKESKKLSTSRKSKGNQSIKRSTRLSVNKVDNQSTNRKGEKKFFKSKLKTPVIVLAHSKISPLKRPVIGKTQKAAAKRKNVRKIPASRPSISFRLRQPTLQESFSKQSKKSLRPRKSLKNYCEKSQMIVDKTKNKDKLENVDEKKGPVYTLVKDTDENITSDDKEKVYEFVFDSNDSKERATKKRKKRIVRKPPAKKAKLVTIEFASNPIISTELPTKKHDDEPMVAVPELVPVKKIDEILKNDNKRTTVTAEIHLPPVETSQGNHDVPVEEVSEEVINEDAFQGPRIISNDKLMGEHRIGLTVTPLQPRSIKDESVESEKLHKFNFRPSMQIKTMMNAPLLRRSLSPITCENPKETIKTDSPWRVPSLNSFSRVKNIFQSTPQGKKFTTLLGKASLITEPLETQKRQVYKMNKITEQNDENANMSLTKKSPEKIQTTNTSKSPRKFGTVISNMINNSPVKKQSMQIHTSKSPRKFGTVISNINESSPKTNSMAIERTILPASIEESIVYDSINTSIPNYDEIISMCDETVDDKENSAPNNESPKKSPIKRINSSRASPLRPKIIQELTKRKAPEVHEPQPGPSGLQKSNPLTDIWNLKQSNLNKFLNLPDMPSSTRISTTHGIFDDAHSTPIVGKTVKKMTIDDSLNVNNAFGFGDDDDDEDGRDEIDLSPIIKYPLEVNQQILVEKKLRTGATLALKKSDSKAGVEVVQQPARFPIGEIKKTILPNEAIKNKNINEKNDNTKSARIKEKYIGTTKKDVVKAIDFSDTFDNINTDADNENVREIPLFVDLEPVHFTQPPRYSYGYKRKRKVSFNTSGETDEEEQSEEHSKQRKKKKIGKVEREQNKALNQWAKSMNDTFEEIDHFDLVVEKNK